MKCLECGEVRVAWKKELWGGGTPQFLDSVKRISFVCGATYVMDEDTGKVEEELAKCERTK
jgi:hypothetical protein